MARAHGIDISKYQSSFDAAKRPDDIQFIVIRASYGVMTDPIFDQLHEQVQPIPVRGAYHYFRSDLEWDEQADHFLSLIRDRGFHFYALDVETAYNQRSAKFARDAERWLQLVADETGQKVVLYTNPDVYVNWLQAYGAKWLPDWPLWIAQYFHEPDRNKNPVLPKGVKDWTFWQYSADGNGKGRLYGVASPHLDLDVFNGTAQELHNWLGTSAAAPKVTAVKKPAPQPAGELDYDLLAKKLAPLLAPLVAKILEKPTRRGRPKPPPGVSFGIPVGGAQRTVEEVKGIGPASAKRLAAAGITTLKKLASAEADDLMKSLSISEERAMGYIEQARRLIVGER